MKIAIWLTLGIASTAVAATVLGQAGALSTGSSAAKLPDPAAPDPSGPRPIQPSTRFSLRT
jgi:hypothetical protein